MSMYLIIDTATKNSSIALLGDDLFQQIEMGERDQTKEMIPKIKSLLEKEGLSLDDLAAIAVCVGPGLFTGTRIGVMNAKTLSFAADIPLIPFNTFDLYENKEPLAVLDAKCDRAYLFDGEIKLIQHQDLLKIKEKIYTLDSAPFPSKIKFTTTQKNIKKLLPLLKNKTPISHDKIEIIYPN